MSFDLEQLWELLPAIHRIRDAELAAKRGGLLDAGESAELGELRAKTPPLSDKDARRLRDLEGKAIGGPLRALFAILAEQVAVLDENLEQLYDDLFIETCAEWVVPYIGDLVGARGVSTISGAGFTTRAAVADTIRLRRRKGTASMLEQLARDTTAWDAAAVEYFQLLATTQYLNHLRPGNLAWASLSYDSLAEINTPFDRVTRNAEIRNIATAGGKYNIPNVGIHLYRIGAHPVTSAAPYPPNDGATTQFFFDPLGRDIPLFEHGIVARHIGREAMYRDLARFYGAGKSILVNVDGHDRDDVEVCDLSAWGRPSTKIEIDPELGRLKLPSAAQSLRVTYFYGAPSNLGGGEYDRASTFENDRSFIIKIDATSTIAAALADLANRWNSGQTFERGIVEIDANDFFIESLSIDVPAKKIVELRATDGRRPVVVLQGAPEITGGADAQVVLSGLLLTGQPLSVPQTTALSRLRIVDCTLAPDPRRLTVSAKDAAVSIERSIVAGSLLISDRASAEISGSIIDALAGGDLAYGGTSGGAGGPITIRNSTVIGRVETRLIELASNVIFAGTNVNASQVQQGCVRFSYVPPKSHVPRPFHCQPSEKTPTVRPRFTSRTFGNPAYCQLSASCPIEIRAGADDGAEMGVYHDLYQPQREANLRARLDEFLRFGLEAGIFYAS